MEVKPRQPRIGLKTSKRSFENGKVKLPTKFDKSSMSKILNLGPVV